MAKREKRKKAKKELRSIHSGMSDQSASLQPLITDPSREAVATIRGYRYQILRTLYAWLELEVSELLVIEGAEDFDHISQSSASTYQTKDTKPSGNITLRSKDIRDAINNFWRLRGANVGRNLRFFYLSTSSIGKEANEGCELQRPGLELWEEARLSRNVEVATGLSKQISKFLVSDQSLNADVLAFLGSATPEEVLEHLIRPICWQTAMPSGDEVEDAIKRKIEGLCWQKNVPIVYAERIHDRLEKSLWSLAGRSSQRYVSIEQLWRIFDDVTTVVVHRSSVPSGAIDALVEIDVAAMGASTATALAIRGGANRVGKVPPLPDVLMPRNQVRGDLSQLSRDRNLINIRGATGTGKSTQAATLSQSLQEEWAWASCRGTDDPQLRMVLWELGRWLDEGKDRKYVVLDDLSFAENLTTLESALPGLHFTLKNRGGLLVVTSHHEVPPRLRGRLSLDERCSYPMPMLSQEEVGEYLTLRGCAPIERSNALANLVYLKTRGHPQLVAANVSALAQRNFPEPKMDDILDTPHAVKEVKDEARLFLAKDLPDAQRELLYRLSMLIGPFSRSRALLVAQIETSIPKPGDAFDNLVGPWLERTSPTDFQLSPLIQNAGQDANGVDWAKNLHASIAQSWARQKEQSQWSVAAILWHSVVGGDGKGVVLVSKGLFRADREVWAAIASADSVFVRIYLDKGQSFPGWNPFEVFCARLTQFKLALSARPELCERILDRIDEEFPHQSDDQMKLLMRNMLLSQVLVHPEIPISIERAVSILIQVVDLAARIPTELDGTSLRLPEGKDLLEAGGELDVANIAGPMIIQRTQGFEDLRSSITLLNKMTPELRRRCLRLFQVDADMSRQLSDAVWLSEYKSKAPRWKDVSNVLIELMDVAKRWGETNLALGTASVLGRTLHENLKETARAIEVLSDARKNIGQSNLVDDAQAKIFSQTGRSQEALELWDTVFDRWEKEPRANAASLGIAMQNAAHTAAAIGDWSRASGLLERAARATERAVNSRFHIGLLADAGYASYRDADYDRSLAIFDRVLAELESIPNSVDEIKDYYLHKVIGHVLTWISASLKREANTLVEPTATSCSNLDPPEDILRTNPTPIDFSWAHLLSLVEEAGSVPPNLHAHMTGLRSSPFPGVRIYVAEHEMSEVLKNGPIGLLADRVADFVIALSSFRLQHESGIKPWEITTTVADGKAILEGSDPGFWYLYLVNGVFAVAALREDLGSTMQEWRKTFARGVPVGVVEFIAEMETRIGGSRSESVKVVIEGNDTWRRLATAAVLLGVTDPDAASVIRVHMFLLTISKTQLNRHLERRVGEALTSAWRIVCEKNSFALRSPSLNVPKIMEAGLSGDPGWSRVARLFLVAAPAVLNAIPLEILKIANELVSK